VSDRDERHEPRAEAPAIDEEAALERAMSVVELLSEEVGARRPTSRDEGLAGLLLRDRLRAAGVEAEVERFSGYASFGYPFGLIQAVGVLPSLLPARMRRLRSALALASGAALAAEGSLRWTPLSDALSRSPSGNVVGTIEPRGGARRTLCLMAHTDTSRSGLLFDPRFVGALGAWISAQSLAGLAQAVGEPLLGGTARGRSALAATRGVLLAGLLLLAEREIRGVDVPGANDNASGCGVVMALASELAVAPLEETRVVVLLTGCEESGTLGAQAFLAEHDTDGWLFLNFDNVGGPGSVRYLRREGVLAKWDADPGLIGVAEEVATADPDLRFLPTDNPAGLTYDTSPVLAAGGRALTISVQDGSIPNLHWPTDTLENVSVDGVARTLAAGRAMVGLIDTGEADS
jgi:hypothetical protein